MGLIGHFFNEYRKSKHLPRLYERFQEGRTPANVAVKLDELMGNAVVLKLAQKDADGSWIVDLYAEAAQICATEGLKDFARAILGHSAFTYAITRYPRLTFDLVITPVFKRAAVADRAHLLVIFENNSVLPRLFSGLTGDVLAQFFGDFGEGFDSSTLVGVLRASTAWQTSIPLANFKDYVHTYHQRLVPVLYS